MVIILTNSEYWKQRFVELEEAQNKDIEKYLSDLRKEYNRSLLRIEKDITDWYARLAENNDLTLTGAKKLLDKKRAKEFKWTVEEYIKKGKENAVNEKWIKELENASARVHIDRLEAIKIQIQNELEQLYDMQNKDMIEVEKQQYQNAYYKSAYEIQSGMSEYWNIKPLDANKVENIISKPWTTDNRTFSDRIWLHKEALLNTLQKNLTQAIIRGESLDSIIKTISQDFYVSKGKAGRLVMTESAFFSSVGQKDCFNNLGVKQYEIVATLDTHTSEICQELDGKVFDMKDYEVGITAPPFHINCRSCTAPYFNDEFTEREKRVARDENGKTIYVNSKMKYKEWYEKYVDKEEGIIDNLYSKNTKLKDITNQKENLIKEAFNNNNIKKIALDTNIKSIKVGGNKSYHRRGNVIIKENYSKHTIIHEIGHAVDYKNKWLSSNKEFLLAIEKDKEFILKNKQKYQELIKNNSHCRELSDIIGGMTSNEVVGRYKHESKYWKKANKLEKEVFAQMFVMAGCNDIEQLEIFKEYLPNTFKEFDNIIRRLL